MKIIIDQRERNRDKERNREKEIDRWRERERGGRESEI